MTPVCKICGAPAACLRLCADHYRERRELEFWGLVDKDDPDGCWLWLGKQRMGYGVFSYGGFPKREQRAHRVAYIWLHGSIPEGLVLDHRCEVKHCVNPAHLEPVTNTENIRRAWAGQPDTESVHRRRRVYGSGSMVEARPGVWKLRWHTGVDPFTGKRTQRQETHHGTRKSATKRLAECVASAEASSTMTLGDLLELHARQAQISELTRERYDYALRHLPAHVRAWRLDEISSPMIAELYRRLEADGVGVPTIQKARTALSSAFRHGIEWGVIDRNPCRGVRPPAGERRTYVVPTVEQLRAMLALADAKPGAFPIWLRLSLASGARRVEVVPLQWGAVSFDADVARIDVATAKTGGRKRRTVALDPETSAALRTWRAHAVERALAVGVQLGPASNVVSDDPASAVPWRLELATKRLARLSAAVGCPGARLHDLRHAHATMLIEAGVSMRTIADRLGHSRVSTTMDIYGHLLLGADEAAAGTFGRLMGEKI